MAAEIKKKDRLREKLEAQLKKAGEAQSLKTYANLLYAQHDKSAKGSTLRVPNLFDPELGEVDIPLAPELSIVENANRYHRLYRKAGRSIPQINERLRTLESEIAALQREQERLLKAHSEKPSAARPNRRSPPSRRRGQSTKTRCFGRSIHRTPPGRRNSGAPNRQGVPIFGGDADSGREEQQGQ